MANIPSPASYTKLNDVQISNDAGITEALFYQIGEQINKLIDDIGDLKTANDKTITNASYSSQTITPGSSLSLLTYSVSSNQNPIFLKLALVGSTGGDTEFSIKNNTTGVVLNQFSSRSDSNGTTSILLGQSAPHNSFQSVDEVGVQSWNHVERIYEPSIILDPSPNSGNNLYVLKNDTGGSLTKNNLTITSLSISAFEI